MAQICENCVTGHIMEGTPKGAWINPEGIPLQAYYASATNNIPTADPRVQKTKTALILAMDGFGFALENPKLQADIYAERTGVDVWVPDIFKGQPPIAPEALDPYVPTYAGQKMGTMATFGKYFTFIKAMPRIMSFRPSVQDPWVVDFVAYLRKTYGYEHVAMVGFCWGGGVVVRLAAKPGVLDTGMAVHPSGEYKSAMPNVVVPIQYGIAEEDDLWDPKYVETIKATWGAKPDVPKNEFITYPGTVHGFGARPNLEVPEVKKSWEKMMENTIRWLKETL